MSRKVAPCIATFHEAGAVVTDDNLTALAVHFEDGLVLDFRTGWV